MLKRESQNQYIRYLSSCLLLLRSPGLPGAVHVDTCCPGIVNWTPFYIQKCPGLDDKLYDYLSPETYSD